MIWQLAKEVWWYESRFPVNALGYELEPLYLRFYHTTPVFTFSESTAADLRGLGFRGTITVIPVGIEAVDAPVEIKNTEPSFIYVGRLSPSKRVHEILEAFAIFRKTHGGGRLLLVGNGPKPYVDRLNKLATRLDVAGFVEFCGWLEGAPKHRLMAQAHALLMASAREGWGLVVTECNACGTPAVVYDVPGLRDSVRHLQTGIVVQPSPRCLAEGMLTLLDDPNLYRRLRKAALRWSQTFSFQTSALKVEQALTPRRIASDAEILP